MYAILEIGGKQEKVEKGVEIIVNRLENEEGSSLTVKEVLFAKKGAKYHIGTPYVKGASVECDIISHIRGDKVFAFKFKRRKSYKRKVGHRQELTKLMVKDIVVGD
ncbi:MAG: 50S ribosomal protein L21 [Candidatus Omnitrophica bacterium]|nr:50S ribosomal protein L21 [Candidatus Omnitrophota bacterium]